MASTRTNYDSGKIRADDQIDSKVTSRDVDSVSFYNKFEHNHINTGFRDGFTPRPIDIDTHSKLITGDLTNCNRKYQHGELPWTPPLMWKKWRGDVFVENILKFHTSTPGCNKTSCLNMLSDYHDRTFYIFNDELGIETPKAIKSVYPQNQSGVSTRR